METLSLTDLTVEDTTDATKPQQINCVRQRRPRQRDFGVAGDR
jgi:hypothetical protein